MPKFQMNLEISENDMNSNNKIYNLKMLLNCGTSASIIHHDVLNECYPIVKLRIYNDKDVWYHYNDKVKLRLIKLNHTLEITAICHKTNQLLYYRLGLVRDIPHCIGIIFYFVNKIIIGQEVSIQWNLQIAELKKSL